MKGYKFIAGAVCPACGDMDSIVLKNNDSEVRCVSCKFTKTKDEELIQSIKILND